MADLFMGAALCVLLLTAVGLLRLLRGPEPVDRMMSAQLFGTGGVAILLLLGVAGDAAALDVALVLALLSAFVSLALVTFAGSTQATSTSIRGDE